MLLVLFVNLLRALFWPLNRWKRHAAAPNGGFVRLDVEGPIVELTRKERFWSGLTHQGPRPTSLERVRELVREVSRDPRVAGLVVVLWDVQGGLPTAAALRSALEPLRAAGKRLVAYLPNGGGTRAVYVASVAERIVAGPRTDLGLVGFAAETPYFKGALERLGIEAEVFAKGRYKTAAESFAREQMSEPQREQVGALLDRAHAELLDQLAHGRGVGRSQAEAWVDGGPWAAERARAAGLVDALAFEDELADHLTPRDGAEPDDRSSVKLIGAGRYLRRRCAGRFKPLRKPKRLAVVELHGPILAPRSPHAVPHAPDVVGVLESLREDPRTAGVLLHVNSPGGSVTTSERLLRAVQRVAEKKPVVACFGDVAASGGYMAALGAHAIVAPPTCVTGSIGVIALRPAAPTLFERLGVRMEVVKRGAHADWGSPARRVTEEERAHFELELDDIYAAFRAAVARARGLTDERVGEIAEGRVWSGHAAHAVGLVDRLGGYDAALAELRARLPTHTRPLTPELVGPRRRNLGRLRRLLSAAALGPLVNTAPLEELAALVGERKLAWCPLRLVER
jgi:protease-4